MVSIRLSRVGRKKAPYYRVVLVDSTKKATGMVLKVLGSWNPKNKEFKIDKEELKSWVGKGAQVSATVKKLLEK